MNTRTILSRGPAHTRQLAADLLKAAPPRVCFALHGPLGAGKTCFVQGLARALGIDRPVTSPTFTLINEYQGSRALYHVDLYRVASELEAEDLGFAELLEGDAVVAVEWAERAASLLPVETVHIRFTLLDEPDARRLVVDA